MIEGQAVAVNFFSLPDVPGRSYVLDVDQITLAIERQNDERPAICATDALPALDHLNGDLWTLPPAPLSRNSRSGAIRGSGRTRTSAVPWPHLRPGKDHGTTAGPRCSPPEPVAGRSGRQPGIPHPASAPTGASESVRRFRFWQPEMGCSSAASPARAEKAALPYGAGRPPLRRIRARWTMHRSSGLHPVQLWGISYTNSRHLHSDYRHSDSSGRPRVATSQR